MGDETCCPIVELRQYTLHPGGRDVLIELFDRELVEGQEAVGMRVVGEFRDLDDPNRFVWLRGFPDMPSRRRALEDFYGGPVWKKHRDAANATMIDWSNVLLLRPARSGSGVKVGHIGSRNAPLVATIYALDAAVGDDFIARVERILKPEACFVTEDSPNDFPALPVREGEHVLVAFSRSAGTRGLPEPAQVLRLEPTPRSRLK